MVGKYLRNNLRVYDYSEYRKLCEDLLREVNKGEFAQIDGPEERDPCIVLGEDKNGDPTEWDLNYYGKKEGYVLAYYNKYSDANSPAGEAEFKNPNDLDRVIKEALEMSENQKW